MKNESANTGSALRSLLTWVLVLLVVANVAVWTAWPFRDKLVALGILAPPPTQRVDLDPQALPPIVERADTVSAEALESPALDLLENTENDGTEATDPPDTGLPPASPASSEVAGEAPVAEQSIATALLGCVIVGPVASREALDAAATRLRSTGALVDSPEGPGVPALDYHVYVERSASREAAEAVLEELIAQSIEGRPHIILRGTYEDAVSVGVHRNRNLAEARRDRIAALGYDVKVRERHRLRAREVSPDALGDLNYNPCPDDEGG